MALKYLDENGLLYFWQKIGNKFVAKETGKGLSTNDLTNALKNTYDETVTTVAGLVAEGGEPNVIEIVKVNGSALTPDSNKAVDVTVPTKTSDLTNDSNFAVDASYVHTDNNFTSTLKNKLDGIASGAEVNAINTIKVNGTAQTISSKAVNITVPTNNNQLTNGAGYQTASQVQTAIDTALAGITGISFEVVQTLPATGDTGTIYLVPNSGTGTNVYDEYIYINNGWEKIGTTAVDLSNYVQFSDLTAITNAEIDTIVAS